MISYLQEDWLPGGELSAKGSQHAKHGCARVDQLWEQAREREHLCNHNQSSSAAAYFIDFNLIKHRGHSRHVYPFMSQYKYPRKMLYPPDTSPLGVWISPSACFDLLPGCSFRFPRSSPEFSFVASTNSYARWYAGVTTQVLNSNPTVVRQREEYNK